MTPVLSVLENSCSYLVNDVSCQIEFFVEFSKSFAMLICDDLILISREGNQNLGPIHSHVQSIGGSAEL